MLCNNIIRDNKQFSHLRARLSALLILMVMMTLGATGAWGQTNLSGKYFYISGNNQGQNSYNLSNTTTNYYLCPTVDWLYYDASATNKFTNVDNGQPFLTSYQYRNGTNDARKAVWKIVKHATQDYYYIIHAIDGKYVVSNASLPTSGANRLRVHLETTSTPDDYSLFKIQKANDGYYYIEPKNFSKWYLNITQGNQNSLQGTDAKNDGPTGEPTAPSGTLAYNNVGGTLGLWNKSSDYTSKFYLEENTFLPSFTVNADGTVTIVPPDGSTIYYTTDNADPETSETKVEYTGPITVTDDMGDAIKAIAVKDGQYSLLATLPIKEYTYKIVNRQRKVVMTKAVKQPAGLTLSGYTSIPADIRSSYLDGETVKFYTFSNSYAVGASIPATTIENADDINKTPTSATEIYVTYTTDLLAGTSRFLHLRGARPLNLKYETESNTFKYINENTEGSIEYTASEAESISTNSYLWYISSGISTGDPYDVFVQNSGKAKYLSYSSSATPVHALTTTAITYFITGESAVDDDHKDITLTIISNGEPGESFTVRINTVQIPTSYHLIDRKGKEILEMVTSTSADLAVPSEWFSPLVKTYHYWKKSAFDETQLATDTYVLKTGENAPTEIGTLTELGDGEQIYVTYDVDLSDNAIDIDGRNSINDKDKKESKTYRLQFLNTANNQFYQEDGSDGVMTELRKAVYPYSNGDGALYVYGDERWNLQLESGASTRSRWLWIIEPANGATSKEELDPYHVRISSFQTQTSYKYKVTEDGEEKEKTRNFHSYLRTYKPEGYDQIVTGVTNDNPLAHGGAKDDLPVTTEATEYMILGTSKESLTLKTFDKIDGERRTVHSFEQYWKNNPTAYNIIKEATGQGVTEGLGVDKDLPETQKAILTGKGWHVYETWANSANWSSNPKASKSFAKGKHWFQTIEMGETLQLVETEIAAMLILLDQHGWEVVRIQLPNGPDDKKRAEHYAAIHKYSSPMVAKYHYWKTGSKVPGYHKYKVSDYATDKNDPTKEYTSDELGRADLANSTPNLPDYDTQALVSGKERDWYVTYDVKPEYANAYAGATTKESTAASKYLLKQGGVYAMNDGNELKTGSEPASIESVPENMQWYLRPNFDIDEEMGYEYDVKANEEDENPISKADTHLDYYNNGKNGFDPYNLQIQSVSNTDRYFTAMTSGSQLSGGAWKGTSTDVRLLQQQQQQNNVIGHDQTKMYVTNATFMVVDDGNGNMRLMPRFDNEKVVTSFTGLSAQLDAATAGDEGNGTQTLSLTMVPTVVTRSSDIKGMGGYYILGDGFSVDTSIGTKTSPFLGIIDGKLRNFSSFGKPLVAYARDATIKNVITDAVSIGSSDSNNDGHNGAIAATASGETRIYNCGINSGSINGTNHVGGIVGHLEDASRVINCYSYANIEGGTDKGGIVGYNNVASTSTNLKTMVMNCMFYGDIASGGNVSPVYGGLNIDNLKKDNSADATQGLNNFNYYAYDELKGATINKYNCALAVEEKYLTRFEFYRLLLNSNKKLAAFYATGSPDNADKKMAKWVLETADKSIDNPKPYPVLKEQGYYPSIINYDTRNLEDYSEEHRNEGRKTGTLTVNIAAASTWTGAPSGAGIKEGMGSLTLDRTDKDFARFNFNYDKVQLPYYNDVGTKNYTGNKVVTGWKITGMTVGPGDDVATQGSYTASDTWGGYNFADRKTYAKDLYSISGRVFSQGAYFDVPYGVTGITIEPYWGNAVYVADEFLDVVYDTSWGSVNVKLGGKKQFPTEKITIDDSEQVVKTSISSALGSLSGSTVYDNAIVLVGNLHQGNVPAGGDTPFTLMSVDLNHDNEPDFSYIYSHGSRTSVAPIRFDFLNIPGTAQAQKPNGATQLRNAAVFKTRGWFELTNTALMYFSQIEYENLIVDKDNHKKSDAPMILLGGVVDQFVSTQSSGVTGKTIYIHVGSNVWFKTFSMGTHGDGSKSTPHVPVSVTGGDYDSFYLTGTYNPGAEIRDDNAECYISGGRFGEVAGAGQEQIGTTGSANNGNVRWQIYDADITEFYGGGINDAKPVQGNIRTDIFNSHVGIFCGGPKFGNMATGKTVTTNAEGCTFGKFYGAGNGGNSYSRKKYYDKDGIPNNSTWSTLNGYYSGSKGDKGIYYDGKTTDAVQAKYGKKGPGVATDFDYEFFVWTSGTVGVRYYVNFASFSLAQCNDVTTTLTGCTVNENFYGGGNLGSVVGTATSVIDGCTIHGNVFGGGYSALLPPIPVRDSGFTKNPVFNANSGMFEPGVYSATTDYEWQQVNSYPTNGTAGTIDDNYVVTKADLTALGQVAHTNLTITGNTKVEGSVFGGGDMSAVNGNTNVDIQNTDGTDGINYVYGGGNTADVGGNAVVTMTAGKVDEDVYGGGKGSSTVVGGNVTVNIGTKDGSTYTGAGTVNGNVYGGSALGAVNAKKENSSTVYSGTDANPKTTTVNIYAGTIEGSVFGGGLGQLAKEAVGTEGNEGYVAAVTAIAAQNFGPTTVTIDNSDNTKALVKTAVYGGSNENGVLKRSTEVTISGGTIGTSGGDLKNVVFGGGFGQPTIVEGDVEVNIGTTGQTSGGAIYHGNIYGGSALGGVNVSDTSGTPVANTKTDVNLFAGTINGNVFGGGLGRKYAAAVASVGTEGEEGYVPSTPEVTAVAATVGGDVTVTLDGAKLSTTDGAGQIFGCNNLNGTPKGHVKVWVKRTVDSDKSSAEAQAKTRDERTTYDVAAVYGGGNQADYVPTKATGTDTEKEEAFAEVLIEGCDLTSIGYVYGGGNAAAVPATEVTVKGTYIIDYVFGGGNGAGEDNLGANVGYKSFSSTTPTAEEKTNKQYGTGRAVTKLVGGKIHVVYGGSNTRGNVRGGTSVSMPQSTGTTGTGEAGCAEIDVREIYGAGQNAEQDGGVQMILGCIKGEDNIVYGGAKDANVKGGVDLVITSGKFKQVFGGNDTSGTIQGPIKLTIEETNCDPVEIKELYLGGKDAAYSVYGYKTVGDKLEIRNKTEYDALSADQRTELRLPYADPILNVVSCTKIGRIFGGGLGSTAVMYGSPTVNLNMVPGAYATRVDSDGNGTADNNANALGVIGRSYSFTQGETTETRVGGIYGGGSEADVYGSPTINIGTKPTTLLENVVDDSSTEDVDEKRPNVQGVHIESNIYGGGLSASVYGSTNINIGTKNYDTTGYEGVMITGNVFGGGQGESTKVTGSVAVKIGERTETTTEDGTTVTYTGNSIITGDVYGGSALGSVNADGETLAPTADAVTSVTLNIGTITGSVYGGGLGQRNGTYEATSDIISDVYGPVTVTVNNGSVSGAVYGCNNLNGSPQNTVAVNINGTTVPTEPAVYSIPTVYGGGNIAPYTGTGGLSVTMTDGYVNNVFGGGLGTTAVVTGNTTVTVSGGTVNTNIYGGGSQANMTGNATVTVSGGSAKTVYGGGNVADVTGGATVNIIGGTLSGTAFTENLKGAVFGGGYGETTKVSGNVVVNIGSRTETTSGESVTVSYGGTATISGDVYGGSAKGKVNTTDGTTISEGSPTTSVNLYGGAISGNLYGGGLGEDNEGTENDHSANVYGAVTVETRGGSVTNVFGCNNILGAPQTTATVNIAGGTIVNNVYGGGNQANFGGNTSVSMSGGQADNIFGGGLSADVAGSVNVSISGGKVTNDVYGGGALANTNTANWSFASPTPVYIQVSGITYPNYTEKIGLKSGDSVTGLYTESGGVYTPTSEGDTSDGTTKYYQRNPGSSVDGLFTKPTTTEYVAASGEAVSGTIYYESRTLPGTWAAGKTSTSNTTTVTLTGGVIGNVYGGGLGNVTTPVYVCGDVKVSVNKSEDISSLGGQGVGFTSRTNDHVTIEGDDNEYVVPLTGRVFGCNNINGTPLGDVQVDVYSTRQLDDSGNVIPHENASSHSSYEIQAVYGGGNQADYVPAEGKGTHVTIDGCNETTIKKVYGGGSSASVPATDVIIKAALDIGFAFGGGNGGEKVYNYTTERWQNNAGARVNGLAKIDCRGGKIGAVFGGSDANGNCLSTSVTQGKQGDCDLVITRMYGAGNEADVTGDVNIVISGCTGGTTQIEYICGGSYNAHITGNVILTITSGFFKSVYGGNESSGGIGGNITVNIEETDDCKPIIIENLVGGGNMAPYPGTDKDGVTISGTNKKVTVNVKSATRINNIYGGGFESEVNGDTEVNINMRKGHWAGKTYGEGSSAITIPNAIGVIGNVYGGGNAGRVRGNTVVNIGTSNTVKIMKRINGKLVDKDDKEIYTEDGEIVAGKSTNDIVLEDQPVLGANITGDVFGGGNKGTVTGSSTVNICIADFSGVVGFEGVSIGGSIYGGGNSADVLGNTNVTMSGGYVFNGIFGGGYSGSVGTFTRSTAAADVNIYGHTSHAGSCIGKPTVCASGTGICTVVVNGDAQIGPVTVATEGMPIPQGWVWGGGCGLIEDPANNPDTHFKTYVGSTDVTIGGSAFIMEGVIGGGEFGRVLGNTHVTIQDNCQIGVGAGKAQILSGAGTDAEPYVYGKPIAYTADQWTAAETAVKNGDAGAINSIAAAMPECHHWDYESPFETYDPYYESYPSTQFGPASTSHPTDGKTWIGVVFGGGSGYMPYKKDNGSGYDWCRSAGWVEGNTLLEIKGGHILTNAYGGNEVTDVKGKCTVKMSGGTIGVPRTLAQIAAHPLTCYLFGGGKGDPRSHFDDYNTSGSVEVEISGGIIYGSIFGGAEDGHVIGNVDVTIKDNIDDTDPENIIVTTSPFIGTWGTSYVDGNVFGGGRGFSGETLTAGNVGGNVKVDIQGGTMLGSIYGGGRLGSVGLDVSTGTMQDGDTHGHVTVSISGGTIGNNHEFKYYASANDPTSLLTLTDIVNDAGRGYWMLNHTKGGNVYAGAMGRREKLGSETAPITEVDWHKLGNVKSTKLTISGASTWIKGNVYGGGEFGAVTGSHTTDGKQYGTEVLVQGGTIGTVIGSNINATTFSIGEGSGDTRYSFGSVYGGGYGTEADVKASADPVIPADPYTTNVEKFGAYVNSNTYVSVSGDNTKVRGSVYGGGEIAAIKGNTNVNVSNGKIGVGDVRTTEGPQKDYVLFGSWRMGNVYGGGKGSISAVYSGIVMGNTNVNISGGAIYHNVYGGGALGSVGTFTLADADYHAAHAMVPVGSPLTWSDGTGTATVTITGGQIGINGWDNGMVNGSSRGDISDEKPAIFDEYDNLAWVNNSNVTIGTAGQGFDTPQPQIKGTVYGGGENGHNQGNTVVNIHSGTIGSSATSAWENGNVFGAGCGIDTYPTPEGKSSAYKYFNPMGGRVRGTSTLNIDGGHVLRSVYGGGSMASVDGATTITISGGRIGYDGNGNGNVYGGPKGSLQIDPTDAHAVSHAAASTVNVHYATTPAADNEGHTESLIAGSVYGGGEAGIIKGGVTVDMTGGLVLNNVYGGGALADTNTDNWDSTKEDWVSDDMKGAANTTHVSLMGGTVTKDVYGGALGRFAKAAVGTEGEDGYVAPVSEISPIVYGDILVELNKDAAIAAQSEVYKLGGIVDKVFGSNDMRGTPMGHVKVHIFSTQHTGKGNIKEKVPSYSPVQEASESYADYLKRLIDATKGPGGSVLTGITASVIDTATDTYNTYKNTEDDDLSDAAKTEITTQVDKVIAELESIHDYDVTAVYGGGNLAPYMPKETGEYSEVVIDGCQTTSIQSVYGGGNAASTPATKVRVNACFLIKEVFGGGNGKDNYTIYDKWYENPGADVGYKGLSYYDTSGSHGNGSANDKDHWYQAIVYDNAKDKEGRQNPANGYLYGSGQATTEIVGGRIIEAYGGSNQKGNIRTMALSQYQESEACAMHVGTTYGAGKSAEIDGDVSVKMDCVKNVDVMYGGSENADMNSGVTVNITNGTFNKVFGGNNVAGTINGPIIINVEEKGCQPIFINELYGGGYYAPYSVYGFKKETDGTYETIEEDDPRDSSKKIQSRIALEATDDGALTTPHRDPQINIISATRIGAIYGGGYKALMIGSPHINVNMKEGIVLATYANSTDFEKGVHGTGDNAYEVTSRPTGGDATLAVGTIGDIYGGGNEAEIHGNTYVDIGTGKWLDVTGKIITETADGKTYSYEEKTTGVWKWYDTNGDPVTTAPTPSRNAAHISGTVFGGGNKASVKKNTYVTMDNGTVETAIFGGGNLGDVGTYNIDSKTYNFTSGTGVCNVTLNGGTVGPAGDPTDAKPGNVFGAGAGSNANFECDKAMADYANITISNGTVKGNVYGGGKIARLEDDTNVTIGLQGDQTSAPVIKGYVYGAGQGVATHGYSGLVRGNSTVTVQGKAKVESSIYGGGELATVGKYNVVGGVPVSLSSGGTCTVTVRDYAEVGRNDMVMTATDGPDDWGHVFGGGKGATPYEGVTGTPYSYKGDGEGDRVNYTDETEYLKYLETLALASKTEVTIGGHAFVKGSVYGGSENGIVQADTYVKIQDNCQIGNGYAQMDDDGKYLATKVSVNRPYTDAEWAAGHLIPLESDPAELKTLAATYYNSNSLPECASWPYGKNTGTEESPVMKYLPYDVYDLVGGVPVHGSDGHTFYGNVFGGGSGYYPYKKKDGWTKNDAKSNAVGQPVDANGYSDGVWHRAAGAVYGNTTVEITGGHILSNVYGGNEMTDVGKFKNDLNGAPTIKDVNGKCTVKMSGGTLGVPRTLKQIAAHPVTCYLFGAGKGDQRINFNTWTNVNDAVVEVSNEARIYGSVFGGGEDGHVLADASVTIKTGKDMTVGTGEEAVTTRYPYIGTTGTSYVDGNIFGGGRGFSGEALTAGSVGGNVQVDISDGTMLGSVYGGGRLASVGTGFTAVTNPRYGQLQPDYAANVYFTQEEITAAKEGDEAYGKTTSDIKAYAGSHGHVTVNISGGTIGNDLEDITVEHTKGGNVFGASMGRLTLLDGSISPIWPKSAIVKTAKTNISGTALIKGSVYGGSELGMVRGDSHVTIGGVLGDDNTITSTTADNPVIKRNVFGGGYGSDDYTTKTTITAGGFTHATYTFTPMQLAGIVCGDSYINIKRGHVQKNVYGGGEMATVGLVDFTTATTVATKKHDNENNGFALSWPYELSFIPYDDSGASTAVGGTCNINITGGRLGLTGKDFMGPFDAAGNAISATDGHVLTDDEEKAARLDNGDVYGGGKGIAGDRYNYAFCANVKDTKVTINYPSSNGATPANYKAKTGDAYTHDCVAGAVYGGGENGHVIGNTEVTLTNGLVGHAIYGGGSGKGKYKTTIKRLDNNADKEVSIYSLTAGKVYGNTKVEMTGGYVVRNIYGGGNMGSVGKGNYSGGADDYSTEGYGETITGNLWTTAFNSAAAESESNQKDNAWHFLNSGKTSVKVTGGQVGYIDPNDPTESMKDGLPYGCIFGGCRGESAPNIAEMPRYLYSPEFFSGYVNETNVVIGKSSSDFTGVTAAADYAAYVATKKPTILGSVFGGGQDGHVRRDTHVTVYGGEIGIAYNDDNRTKVKTSELDIEEELGDAQWLHRGNVYGAGSGIGQYKYDFNYDEDYDDKGIAYGKKPSGEDDHVDEQDYSTSAGSVSRFTQVDILGGTIHRNVYGGGSLSSVGAPKMGQDYDLFKKDDTNTETKGKQSQCTVNIGGGASLVTIGTPEEYQKHYGGEVYGASRGMKELDAEMFGTTIWTRVNIYDKVKIMGNVFGGGDAGMVKKDSEVRIGDPKE